MRCVVFTHNDATLYPHVDLFVEPYLDSGTLQGRENLLVTHLHYVFLEYHVVKCLPYGSLFILQENKVK